MRCRFCNKDKTLTRAHIIPRSFFKRVRGGGKYSVEMRVSKKDVKEKYLQAGNYDCEILCEQCERKFSPYDAHGHSVFTKVFEEPALYRDKYGIECAYLLPDVDFRLLKLFVLSVLWRASVSRLYFFRDVDLGSHANTIKSLTSNGTIEGGDNYQFVCSHQRDHPYPKGILPPWSRKIEGINYVQLYLPDIQILVKVDKRPLPEFFAPIVIKPTPPHYLVFFPFKGSPDSEYFEGMKRTIRDHRWPTK